MVFIIFLLAHPFTIETKETDMIIKRLQPGQVTKGHLYGFHIYMSKPNLSREWSIQTCLQE